MEALSKTVCILGAGNAGLFAAHILKKNRPGLNIIVVGSKEVGIVGVGESSTEHIQHVTKALGITAAEMCKNTGSTFKFGVWLDWQEQEWVHSLFAGDSGDNPHVYNDHDLYTTFASGSPPIEGIPLNTLEGMVHPKQIPNQFHFDTHLLNKYLIEQAEAKGIHVHDDVITDFIFDDDGYLKQIESETNIYPADIFIDASGFARLLPKRVKEFEWISQQHNMFCDRAFAFPTEHPDDPNHNYLPFTMAKKMSSGWMWQIPVHHRQGNGYVYSSKHLTYDEAVAEVEEKLGHKINVVKTFEFEAGHYNKTMHKNMILCGLSSHFFEPLEATAMGVGIQQARLLCKHITGDRFDDSMAEGYNREVQKMFRQMWTFLRLHYINAVPDSPFWKDVAKAEIPKEVQKILDIVKHRMLNLEDIDCHLDWYIFHEVNFNQVLYCIGALSPEVAMDHIMMQNKVPRTGKDMFTIDEEHASGLIRHKDYVNGLINGTIDGKKLEVE